MLQVSTVPSHQPCFGTAVCAGHAAATTSAQATAQCTMGIRAGTPQRGKAMRVRKAPEVYTPLPTPLVAAAGSKRGATGKRKAAAADRDGEQDAWVYVSVSDKAIFCCAA